MQQTPKHLHFGTDAAEQLKKGILMLRNAVGCTLGPAGRTVFIQQVYGSPIITKDGVTVTKHIHLMEPIQEMVVDTIRQVAIGLGESKGDGTTTSTVLACDMSLIGIDRKIQHGPAFNAYQYARGIRAAADKAIKYVKEASLELEQAQCYSVAKVSANGDHDVATMVAQAYSLVPWGSGAVGFIRSNEPGFYTKKSTGYTVKSGWSDNFFAAINTASNNFNEADPLVLVCGDSIQYAKEVAGILQHVVTTFPTRPLIIFAREVTGEALAMIKANVTKLGVKWVCVNVYGQREQAIEYLRDIAAVTGAKLISVDDGFKMELAQIQDLGSDCRAVLVDANQAILMNYNRETELFQSRIAQLEAIRQSCLDAENKERAHSVAERINMLTGDYATIVVGQNVAVSGGELYDRVEDAVCAVRSAQESGYIIGGGNEIAFISEKMIKDLGEFELPKWSMMGYMDFCQVLKSPFSRIRINSGLYLKDTDDADIDPTVIDERIATHIIGLMESEKYSVFAGGNFEDVTKEFASQVIDPSSVVIECINLAADMAASIISTQATVSLIRAVDKS